MPEDRSRNGSEHHLGRIAVVVGLILIVSLGVLLVRSTQHASAVQQQSQQQIEQLQRSIRQSEALVRLAALRTEVGSGLDPQALQDRYDAIRVELQQAYADEAIGAVQADLEQLRSHLRDDDHDAASDTIDRIVSELSDRRLP